jgi:hypothetical protein
MSDSSAPGLLSPVEYERRKVFLEGLKGLTKAEYIEIVRILQRHEAPFSENDNGIFFNVANVSQAVFDALELFMNFTHMNRKYLAERELYMSTLKPTSKPSDIVVEK